MFRKMIAVGVENQTKQVSARLMHHAGSLSAVTNITCLNGLKLRHNFGKSAQVLQSRDSCSNEFKCGPIPKMSVLFGFKVIK